MWSENVPGHFATEVVAKITPGCAAFVDASFVVGEQPAGDRQPGHVRPYLVSQDGDRVLAELPGVAISALRGWVTDWRPV